MSDPNNDRKEKMLDDLLDGALAEYSQMEPQPGLENRVLAMLASRDDRAVRWNWKWAMALAAACLLIAVLVVSREHESEPVIARKSSGTAGTTPTAAIPRSPSVPSSRSVANRGPKRPKTVVKTPEPVVAVVTKQPVFPAPSRLSDQERLLFAYLRKTPYQELVQNSKPDEPEPEIELNRTIPGPMRDSDRNTNLR